MSDLKIRRIPFSFDGGIPFQWLPSNPDFGHMLNAISIVAVAFEKYIVAATRLALPRIADAEVAREAELFLRQEAQHARVHRLHLAALVQAYPGLQATVDSAVASYDDLLETESLAFHLAYIADLEATFTPIFKVMLDHEEYLFRPGDPRVASLFLWHFVEEVEHRSSALDIYHAIVPNRWYRLRVLPAVARHVAGLMDIILTGFDEHVPAAARLVSAQRVTSTWGRETAGRVPLLRRRVRAQRYPTTFAAVPTKDLMTMTYRLALSQFPGHRPVEEPVPAFAARWLDEYERGRDMTDWYAAAVAV